MHVAFQAPAEASLSSCSLGCLLGCLLGCFGTDKPKPSIAFTATPIPMGSKVFELIALSSEAAAEVASLPGVITALVSLNAKSR